MKKYIFSVCLFVIFAQSSMAGINIESLTLRVNNKKCEPLAEESRHMLKLYLEAEGKSPQIEKLIEKQIHLLQKYLKKCLKGLMSDYDIGASFKFDN